MTANVIGKPYVGQAGCYTYINELGRDSLRIILEHFPKRKYLVPDHYCPTIIELMDTLNINYEFYHVNENLEPDIDDIKNRDYDVFYYINFRGYGIEHVIPQDKILLEDLVFHKDFGPNHPQYIGFNSWRKCTPLYCGSMIKSTFVLKNTYFRMPATQIALLIDCDVTKYKHYLLDNRDEVQEKLIEEQIYLPVFWRGTKNVLSEKILSIPIDDRYTTEDIERVEQLINNYKS